MAGNVVWHGWRPVAALCTLFIIGTIGPGPSFGPPAARADAVETALDGSPAAPSDPQAVMPTSIVPTAVSIRKHPLGHTTSVASSEVGKIYVPSRYGGLLTINASAKLYYTDGSDLTGDLAAMIYLGQREASLVAQGNPCTYTVPQGRWGWFYLMVAPGTATVANTFVDAGQAAYRPWNGWWWALPDTTNPNLYDPGGPLDKYDQVHNSGNSTLGDPQRVTFYQQNMNANPGWTTTGAWAWGQPTGGQGTHGGRDPVAGYTGTNVYGYNLTGGYTNNMTPQYLTTTAIDCSGQSSVHLRFRRWLCIEESKYDHASVQISTNLTNWTIIWNFSGGTLVETSWSLQDIDISSIADGQRTVYIRWAMGPTDVGWTWGGWNIDDVELTGLPPASVFYRQNLDTNPGWTTTGAWAFGVPAGRGGDHGGADPTAGYTGSNVYGYNLAGGYANNMTPQYLTTTAIDCSTHVNVHLRFRRWLCIEESNYDHASVQVSTNLTNWITIWNFSGGTLVETGWSLQDIDISSIADGQRAVYIRWVMGPTDQGWTWGGWNIDDIELTGREGTPPQQGVFYQQKMDTNPGWTTEGSWAWGRPLGGQGTHGGRDPTAGYTGSNVYGYNLAGGYANVMMATSLTTTPIDCSARQGVHLRFRRWLGIEESRYDHASVQVTSNIANPNAWITVWNFSGGTLSETAWSLQEYDISAVADGQPVVYIRWVMGPTDQGWTWGGWNIDDVELVSGNPVTQPPNPVSYARSWEAANHSGGGWWWGHCWGWSIASILIAPPQATTKNGITFTRDDMEGLYTELADNPPYVDPSLTFENVPRTAPTAALGQDIDRYCDDFYRVLRISIRDDRVPLQTDMRAQAIPPNRFNEIWNHAIYKYSASFREVPGTNNERLVELNTGVWANSDARTPPTDYTDDRYEQFIWQLEFDTQGQVLANSTRQNWVYASHYAPWDLTRLTGCSWVPKNPYVTKARVDSLYYP